jgi:hypothetical protein
MWFMSAVPSRRVPEIPLRLREISGPDYWTLETVHHQRTEAHSALSASKADAKGCPGTPQSA